MADPLHKIQRPDFDGLVRFWTELLQSRGLPTTFRWVFYEDYARLKPGFAFRLRPEPEADRIARFAYRILDTNNPAIDPRFPRTRPHSCDEPILAVLAQLAPSTADAASVVGRALAMQRDDDVANPQREGRRCPDDVANAVPVWLRWWQPTQAVTTQCALRPGDAVSERQPSRMAVASQGRRPSGS